MATLTANGRKSCVNKKRRRVDRGREAVLSEFDLSPDLWATLPKCLIGEIVAKLPWTSLVRFCSVCKGWRDLILHSEISPPRTSDHGHLFLFFNEKLITFNSSRGTWEVARLQFLQMHFELVDVVSSAGGLLCFSTAVVGQYVVCNPLTKSFKRLQMPCGPAPSTSDQPCMPIPPEEHPNDREVLEDPIKALLVGMVLHSDTGHFKLVVAGYLPWSGRTTLVYDSASNLWKKVANFPEDVPKYIDPYDEVKRIVCGGNFYVYFLETSSLQDRLFKYDVEEEEWISILLPQLEWGGMVNNITEYNGKVLLVTRDAYSPKRFSIFELQETGSKLWLPTDSLPCSRLRENSDEFNHSQCLGQGDAMFFTRTDRFQYAQFRHLLDISVTGWLHNVATKSYSEVSLKLEEFEVVGDDFQPDFQTFRPSMLGVK